MTLLPAGDVLLEEMVPKAKLITQLTVQCLNPAEQVALIYLLRRLSGEL
jgi:hypothetical protein